jgi:hypothetical protein
MHLKYPYEIMEVEGQRFAVPMEEDANGFNGVIKLSKTAQAIFELLQEDTSEEAIVEAMSRRFDADKNVLAADVHGIVVKLQQKGILE